MLKDRCISVGFGVVAVFMVAHHNNARFGAMRCTILVGIDNEDAHGRKGFRNEAPAMEVEVGFLVDPVKDLVAIKSHFFFFVGGKPGVTIRVGGV